LDASDPADANVSQRSGDYDFDHAYLSDFGMSKAFSSEQIIAMGELAGTLDYAAPEQIEGPALDGRADLYSLACTGFELLCGGPPFGQDQGLTLMYAQLYVPPPAATAKRADLPAAADSVLATALAKNPADRYPSCGQFAEELGAALGLRPGKSADRPRSRNHVGPVARSGLAAEPGPPDLDAMGEPDASDPEPSGQRSHVLKPVLVAVAVVVVAAAVASGVALSKRSAQGKPVSSSAVSSRPLSPSPSASASASPSPTPSPSGRVLASEQAVALGALLTSSAAARTALDDAVDQVAGCTNLSGAVGQLQDVVNQRSNEYGRASTLPTAALPDGAAVKSKLIAALGSSLKADRDYLTWARQQLNGGCTPPGQSSAYIAAYSASQTADAAKEAFVQVWNPVAAKYGIEQNSPGSI
jgi:Protein kinase domain